MTAMYSTWSGFVVYVSDMIAILLGKKQKQQQQITLYSFFFLKKIIICNIFT